MNRSHFSTASRLLAAAMLIGSLASPARAEVIIPRADDGATVYSGTTGLCLLCTVSDEALVIDGDLTNYATLTIPLGVTGGAYLGVTFPEVVAVDGRWRAGFLVENENGPLGVQLLGRMVLRTYLGGELQQTAGGTSLLTLNLIGGSRGYVVLNAQRPFDEIRISVEGAASLLTSLRVYYAGARSLPQYETEITLALASQGAGVYSGTGGLCLGCAVTDEGLVIDNDLASHATINLPLGVTGSAHVGVTLPRIVPGGRAVGFLVSDGSGPLGIQLLEQLTLTTYLGGEVQETATKDHGLRLSLIRGGQQGAVRFFAREPFDEVRLEVSGLALALTTVHVHAAGVATRTQVDRQAGETAAVFEADALADAFEALLDGAERAGAAPSAAVLQAGATLGHAYPNPTASTAALALTVEAPQHVRVAAYDLTGRRVAVLHDGALPEGTHTLRFDGATLPAGTYLIRAEGETFQLTRPLVLSR